MESKWPIVELKEVVEQNTCTESLQPEKLYRLLGVRLEGRGPFIREERFGYQISAKKLRRVSLEEFIYSRLFAWRGAFGLISEEVDGSFVSNEFPTFKIDKDRIIPRFLELYFQQRWVWNEVERYCTGTTKASRNRFKEKFFLDFSIPVPPLSEQARIVVLGAKVHKLKQLEQDFEREAEELISSILSSALEGTS